jgi:tetratricopeptide (TPR) repeat protein
VRSALESYRGETARLLLERLGGFEAECLRARAELLSGDSVAALAALERARAVDAAQPELLATEVECLALLDRVPSALEALAKAFERAGPAPELFRAQGVVDLCRQGRGEAALAALARARALDATLPFVARPLAQAHLLVGRALLEKRPAESTAHAMAALALVLESDSVFDEALELEAEGLAGERRFEAALARYERLEERGGDHRATRATLHHRAATSLLLERRRDAAVEHYMLARRLGLSDEELGFGAEVLREEGHLHWRLGVEASAAGDWTRAHEALERAHELTPGDPEVLNHLGVARFQRAEYRAAAEAWDDALARGKAAGHVWADPVPLDLAKAWRMAAEPGRARTVLAELIDAEPEGPWSAEARELLFALEAEALAEK